MTTAVRGLADLVMNGPTHQREDRREGFEYLLGEEAERYTPLQRERLFEAYDHLDGWGGLPAAKDLLRKAESAMAAPYFPKQQYQRMDGW